MKKYFLFQLALICMLPYAVAQWTTEDLSLPRFQIGIGEAGGKVFFAGFAKNGNTFVLR